MAGGFLLYGANGFVGEAIAHLAVQQGLQPILAGRDAAQVERLAGELGLPSRVFGLDDIETMDRALGETLAVLHCAGPYLHTSKPVADGCLRTRTHYLDLTGEIPVYAALAARDAEAKARGVMLLPGAGFDAVPTDCLALHLKQRLPSAAHLALAFASEGPAGSPPGTQRTAIEMAPYGFLERRRGQLGAPERPLKTRLIDFGNGPIEATQMPWPDVFTAYYSTGIPNVENYLVLSKGARRLLALMPLLRWAALRKLLQRGVRPGPPPEAREKTSTHVWGEVVDDQGRRAVSRLHGPDAGVTWTARAALAIVRKVLGGDAPPGFQTPARAYGADLALEAEGVTREDVI